MEAIDDPKTILVSEREWQEVVGGIRALRMDYEALARETKDLKTKYAAAIHEAEELRARILKENS